MLRKVITTAVLAIMFALPAQSSTITYEKNFSDFCIYGTDANLLIDSKYLVPQGTPVYSTEFILSSGMIESGSLSLTQTGNLSMCFATENWMLNTSDAELIGNLSQSNILNGWKTDTWQLSQSIIGHMNDSGFLRILFWETTGGVDSLFIDKMSLTTETSASPVPEPATMFLLGTGILGLSALRRKQALAPVRNK